VKHYKERLASLVLPVEPPLSLAHSVFKDTRHAEDPAYLVRLDKFQPKGSGLSLGRTYVGPIPGSSNCAVEAHAATHQVISHTAFTNPSNLTDTSQTAGSPATEIPPEWSEAWVTLCQETFAAKENLEVLAGNLDSLFLAEKTKDIVRQFQDLVGRNPAKTIALATYRAAHRAAADASHLLGSIYETTEIYALWPPVAIAASKATILFLQRGDVPDLAKECVLAYSAVWAYMLIGLENTNAADLTPRTAAAKAERGIREIVQALVAGNLEDAKTGTVGLLEVIAEKPIETALDQAPGSLIAVVLGQGQGAEAASSSAQRDPESLLVRVSPKSRAAP
jgi:hypothetical protein